MAKQRNARTETASFDPSEFASLLRERFEELWADIQREIEKQRSERYGDIVERAADPADESVGDLLVDLDIAEISRDVAELRKVQSALVRVKSGTYGYCASCGELIDERRLRAVPHAVLCVDCKRRQEQNLGATPSL